MSLTKKLCAIVLSLVLLISCMGVFTVSAATDIELELVGFHAGGAGMQFVSNDSYQKYDASGSWRMFFEGSATSPDFNTSFGDYTVTWNNGGVTGSSAVQLHPQNASGVIWAVIWGVPAPTDLCDGATMKIAAGTGTASNGNTITRNRDVNLVWDADSQTWTYIAVANYSGVQLKASGTNYGKGFYANSADSVPYNGDWLYRYYSVGEQGEITLIHNGVETKISNAYFQKINASDYYFNIESTPAVAGDTIRVSGIFVCRDHTKEGSGGFYSNMFAEIPETYFNFDGTNWSSGYTMGDSAVVLSHLDVIAAHQSHTAFYTKFPEGTTGLTIDPKWHVRFYPANNCDGGFVNGTGNANRFNLDSGGGAPIQSSAGADGLYITGFGTATAGTTVTLMGNFYAKNRDTGEMSGEELILYAPVTFTFDGTTWTRTSEVPEIEITYDNNFSGTFSEPYNSKATSFYMHATEGLNGAFYDDSWGDRLEPVNDENSGIFLNGVKEPISGNEGKLLHFSDNNWFVSWNTAAKAGDIITIKGDFVSTKHSTKVTIEECQFIYDGTTWTDYIEYSYTDLALTGFVERTGDTLYLHTDKSFPGSWEKYVGLQISLNGGEKINKYVGNAGRDIYKMTIDLTSAEWATISAGSTLTIYAGEAKSLNGADYDGDGVADAIRLVETYTFVYDGTAWEIPSTTVYTDMSVESFHDGNTQVKDGNAQLFLYVTDTMPGVAWEVIGDTAVSWQQVVVINGNEYIASAKKWDAKGLFVEFPISYMSDGDTVTIKAGKYKSNVGNYGYNLTEDYVLQYKNGDFIAYVPYNDVTITGIGGDTNLNVYLYLNTDVTMPGEAWGSINDVPVKWDQKITINGTEYTVTAKKAGDQTLFIEFSNSYLTKPGDTIVIKAGKYKSNVGELGYNLTADYTLTYTGTGFVAGAFATTELTFDQFISDTSPKADRWHFYLHTTANIPGSSWGGVFPQVITVDGVETTLDDVKKADGNNWYANIPYSVLPSTGEHTLVFKAGWYKSSTEAVAYYLAADVTIYMNKYGMSFAGFITPNVTVSSLLFNSSDGVNGFYVTTSGNDGAEYDAGWGLTTYANHFSADKQHYYFGENGFYVNGEQHTGDNKYTGKMKKLNENTYYVCLIDQGVSALVTKGTELVIQGLFHDDNGYLVEFTKSVFEWDGTTWANVMNSNVEKDVNADGVVDVQDAVLLERHLVNPTVMVSNQADIDGDGKINATDLRILRRYLLGINIVVENGVAQGTPYYAGGEMIKAAFVAPEFSIYVDKNGNPVPYDDEGNGPYSYVAKSDDEIRRMFQEYKDAGFTHLITENRAVQTTDSLDSERNQALYKCLEIAEEFDLKVIVVNDLIHGLIMGNLLSVYPDTWQSLVTLYINTLKEYPAFWGYMLGDEPTGSELDNYLTVSAYLHQSHPDVGIFNASFPNYVSNSTITNANAGVSSYKDYVKLIGTTNGHFMYDNYALRTKTNWSGSSTDYYLETYWFTNLLTVAELGRDYGFTTGVTMQSVALTATGGGLFQSSYQTRPIKKKADIGFQVYTALAYGMKELDFFTYGDHWDDEMVDNTAMIKVDGTPNEHYYFVQDVYNDISALEQAIVNFSWLGTIESGLKTGANNTSLTNNSTYTAANNSRLNSATFSGAAVVGCMKDKVDGFDGYMIANAQEPFNGGNSTVTLKFYNATKAMVYWANGSVSTVNLTNGAYTFSVGAGEGCFVIPMV